MRINVKNIALAASLSLTLAMTGLTGCANKQGRSYGAYWDDHRTAAHVKKALNDQPVYKFPTVNITSYDHVVQLSGFVQTDEQRKIAGEIASTVQGVKEVVNNILIKSDGAFGATGRTNAPIRMGQPVTPTTPGSSTSTNAPAPSEETK